MKKKPTIVNQPDKVETTKLESQHHLATFQKLHHYHGVCEHTHGRVNKYPFGGTHGPSPF